MAESGSAPRSSAGYHIERLAERPDLYVSLMTIEAGSAVPWHHHSAVADTIVCVTGRVRIESAKPDMTAELAPGEVHTVPVGVPHRVSPVGGGACRVVLIQGGGAYDFLPLDDAPAGAE